MATCQSSMYMNFRQLMWSRVMKVPRNQRPYAWEEKHLKHFWEDINAIPEGKSHYMSGMIIQKHPHSTPVLSHSMESLQKFIVVDGQQRITTIILLIRCLINYLDSPDFKRGLLDNFIRTQIHDDIKGSQKKYIYRLRLHKDISAFFKTIINGESLQGMNTSVVAHKRLRYAKRFFEARITSQKNIFGNQNNEFFQNYLINLCTLVCDRLYFNVFFADTQTDIGILFESSNCRGRELTNLENIKNRFLYLANLLSDENLSAKIDKTWSYIYETFMWAELTKVSDEDQFLHGYWQCMYDSVVADKVHLYEEMCKCFDIQNGQDDLARSLNNYLDNIRVALKVFCNVYSPFRDTAFEDEEDQSVIAKLRDASISMHRLGTLGMFMPMIMAAYIRDKTIKKEKFLQLLQACEKYVMMVYCIAEKRSNTGKPVILRLGGQIYTGTTTINNAIQTVRIIARKFCTKEMIKKYFGCKMRNFYEGWNHTKYFLIQYEIHLRKEQKAKEENKQQQTTTKTRAIPHNRRQKQGAKVIVSRFFDKNQTEEYDVPTTDLDPNDLSIEHVLPRIHDSCIYWQNHFGSAENCDKYLNRLGNLSICRPNWNASYGSKSFDDKKNGYPYGYTASDLLIERQLATYAEWNPESINQREIMLSNWAVQRWYL